MNVLRLFLSSSPDLRRERERVAHVLQAMGIQVVMQEMFGASYGSVIESIKNQIQASDGFIQLIGFDLGASPPPNAQSSIGESGSYVQIEGKLARKFAKPTYLFFAHKSLKNDSVSPESEAAMEAYREQFRAHGFFGYVFSTTEELELKIAGIGLKDGLARSRQKSGFRIFLSYRRQEPISKCVAHRLYEGMTETFGTEHVFLDVHSIPLGQDYRAYLDTTVARANFMCAVIGPGWVTTMKNRSNDSNDYVRYEIESAFRLNIPVAPILIEDAQMPKETEIPESLRQIIAAQGMQIRVGSELYSDIRDLNHRIQSLVPEPH